MPIQPVTHIANSSVPKLGENTRTQTEMMSVPGTLLTTLRTSFITRSTFLEKPQMAPTTMPIEKFMMVHRKASERLILAPYHMESKVDCPEAPVPKIHLMEKPNFSMASLGDRCFAAESMMLP